jgi:hypothetical protein
LTYSDGEKYVGGYKVGERHGQGTVTYSDGDMYYGEWKNSTLGILLNSAKTEIS